MMKQNKLYVIKIGGNVIDDTIGLSNFLKEFSKIKGPKILIHGGGKIASQIAEQLNIKVEMHEGKRITSLPMLNVATMVYSGLINKTIVAKLQHFGCNSIGLSGADANCIITKKRTQASIDYGYVGDIQKKGINHKFIHLLLAKKITPVFCSISKDKSHQLLNTNADSIASIIAISMSKYYDVELIYCFEKNGVMTDPDNMKSIITNLNKKQFKKLKSDKIIHSGMIPKLEASFNTLKEGVNTVKIMNSNSIKKLNNKNSNAYTTIHK